MAKRKVKEVVEPVVVQAEETKEVVAEPIVEQPQEPIKNLPSPKFFMYKKWNGRTFETRRFTLQTMKEDDMNYFLGKIMDAYNEAPLPAQIEFMIHAWPGMENFLKDRYPDILVEMEKMIAEVDVLAENIIEDKSKGGLKIVN